MGPRLDQGEGEALYELDLFTLGDWQMKFGGQKFGKKSYILISIGT